MTDQLVKPHKGHISRAIVDCAHEIDAAGADADELAAMARAVRTIADYAHARGLDLHSEIQRQVANQRRRAELETAAARAASAASIIAKLYR
jgi:ribonuclease HII